MLVEHVAIGRVRIDSEENDFDRNYSSMCPVVERENYRRSRSHPDPIGSTSRHSRRQGVHRHWNVAVLFHDALSTTTDVRFFLIYLLKSDEYVG